ncbi:MAG: transglycosylase SLT domain-containing protein [Actinobacteria bacterium]|nr:transglycosylase SLT domain-containing protein [Actinomycetota bacterium]
MDLDMIVRLVQMQMYTNNFESRRSEESGMGTSTSNFALILAALMDSNNASSRAGQTGRRISSPGAGMLEPLKTAGQRHYPNPAAGPVSVSSNTGLDHILESTAKKFGIDPGLLKAVAKVESDFNPFAVSKAGAMGLMQLMPGTAASLGVENPFDATENVEGGARYLRSLMDRYGGDAKLALAAYNAGPGAVDRHGGVPPYRETTSYLNKINNIFRIF